MFNFNGLFAPKLYSPTFEMQLPAIAVSFRSDHWVFFFIYFNHRVWHKKQELNKNED